MIYSLPTVWWFTYRDDSNSPCLLPWRFHLIWIYEVTAHKMKPLWIWRFVHNQITISQPVDLPNHFQKNVHTSRLLLRSPRERQLRKPTRRLSCPCPSGYTRNVYLYGIIRSSVWSSLVWAPLRQYWASWVSSRTKIWSHTSRQDNDGCAIWFLFTRLSQDCVNFHQCSAYRSRMCISPSSCIALDPSHRLPYYKYVLPVYSVNHQGSMTALLP